jgi:hypothetical protein
MPNFGNRLAAGHLSRGSRRRIDFVSDSEVTALARSRNVLGRRQCVQPAGRVRMNPDPDRARCAAEAMLKMRKINIAELERAADGR